MDNPPVVPDIGIDALVANTRRPFYRRPVFWVLIALIGLVVLIIGAWLTDDFLNRKKPGGAVCHLLKPITYLSDIGQRYYNDNCRVAWLTAKVPIEKPVNIISFEMEFVGDPGARGVMTISLDNQQIGVINQADVEPGNHEYRFDVPSKEPGEYEITFRLEPTNDLTSSVNVNKVRTGFLDSGQSLLEKTPQFETKMNPIMDFLAPQPFKNSIYGEIKVDHQAITLQAAPNEPAWIVIPFELREEINTMEFDIDFISNPAAEGLVAVYIDDRVVGQFDERFTVGEEAMHEEVIALGGGIGNLPAGAHKLSIRLDNHSQETSVVQISNLQTGLVSRY